jgi:hypothetical protein
VEWVYASQLNWVVVVVVVAEIQMERFGLVDSQPVIEPVVEALEFVAAPSHKPGH